MGPAVEEAKGAYDEYDRVTDGLGKIIDRGEILQNELAEKICP